MEEQQERRNVGEIELKGGQPNKNSGQTGLEPEKYRIDVEISHTVKIWIESLKNAEENTQSQSQWPRIPKGYLTFPPIIIDGSTKLLFLNIVAYEMCLDGPGDHRVTSYMRFLDNLIDHANDVKELRSKHILYNGLSSDEKTVQTFNEIYTD
ncbi:hypothetical protein VitviT2T_020982 [Vitis vinifera]|uniref:Uncharacterized protein n=1 Tax=Vitis vinifera TaxID=29760 RepID=A0ABY9D658_VITVI|nr:hypothetical protein VitviT2T_020982 [Vitis vinifera]